MSRFRLIALLLVVSCARPAPVEVPVTPVAPPDLETLPAWPAAVAPRTFPPAGLEYVPAVVRGHLNRRTPSPDTLTARTSRVISDGLFAALKGSLANRKGTAADVDFNQVPILMMRQSGAPPPTAILVLISGLYAGGGSFVSLGAELVAGAKSRGKVIEVWAIDRRSNLLEDRFGITAASEAHDPNLALDYYGLDGREPKPVQGRSYVEPPHKDFLFQAEWGLDTHLRDYRAVVLAAKKRSGKVFLGGHSLGGMQTGAYLGYDFAKAGAPEELGAADVAGAIQIDGTLTPRKGGETKALDSYVNGGDLGEFGFPIPGVKELRTPRDGDTLPGTYLSVKGLIDPPLLQQLGAVAVGALDTPAALARLTVPGPFVVASNGPRTMVGPYAAVFPATLDDDFSAVGGLRFSLGFPDDAPASLAPGSHRSDYSNPLGVWALADTTEQRPLKWLDSKALALKAKDPAVPQYGTAEPQDFRTTAQALSGGPTMDFLEWYYPLRLLLDLQIIGELGLDTARLSDGDLTNDGGVETELTRFGESGLRLVGLSRVDAPMLALRGEYGVIQGGAGSTDRKAGEREFSAFAKLLAPARGGKARLNSDGSYGAGFQVLTLDGYTHNDVLFAEPNRCVAPILDFLDAN